MNWFKQAGGRKGKDYAGVRLARQAYLPNTLPIFVGFSSLFNLMFLKILAAFVHFMHIYDFCLVK